MKERNKNLDLIRTIAIFLVVFVHSYEYISIKNHYLGFFLYYLGRCGVPLFLLITGALNFNKKISIKKIFTLSLIFFFWSFIFNIISQVFFDNVSLNNLDIKKLILESLEQKNYFRHTWYLKQILIIYILLFIKSRLPENFSLYYTYSLAFIFSGIFLDKYNIITLVGFVMTHLGYLIYNKKNIFYNNNYYFFTLMFFFSFGVFVLSFEKMTLYTTDPWWYWNVFILMSSISIFNALLNIKIRYFANLFETISKHAFGIYLFHLPCIALLYTCFPNFYNHLNLITLFILVFLMSFFITFCFKKTILRKLFL